MNLDFRNGRGTEVLCKGNILAQLRFQIEAVSVADDEGNLSFAVINDIAELFNIVNVINFHNRMHLLSMCFISPYADYSSAERTAM